jgi:AmpD protein
MSPSPSAWQIDQHGWCRQAVKIVSPNFDGRPGDGSIDLLVIHNISLPPRQFGGPHITALFTNTLDYSADPYFDQLRDLRVSSHFVIRRDGQLLQFVSTLQRAWHAGLSVFQGRTRCNDFSIGIELEGSDFEPFSEAQYQCLAQLTQTLQQAHRLRAVTGHQHIAAGRKTDPGSFFDWRQYQSLYNADDVGDCAEAPANLTLQFITIEQIPADDAIKKIE